MKAAADEKAAKESASAGNVAAAWGDEFGKTSLPSALKAQIAGMGADEQDDLHARWVDAGKRKDWLKTELDLRGGGAARVVGSAAYSAEKDVDLLRRAMAAGAGGAMVGEVAAGLVEMYIELLLDAAKVGFDPNAAEAVENKVKAALAAMENMEVSNG